MLELPVFVCVLFVGVILSNGLALAGFYRVFERAVSVLGNVSLSLFLAMALMSLKLWELASLALPMLAILVVQTIFMALYAIFVTWRMMGKNYDAAVLAAGHCGFGLGRNADRHCQYAGDYRPFWPLAYGVPGRADGRRVFYRYRQCAGDQAVSAVTDFRAIMVCTAAFKPPCSLGVRIAFSFRHPALNQRRRLLRITFMNMPGNTLNFGNNGLIAQ
ncbi:glutamate permease [Salmonella enterica subsp. arizonae]|uniref:Glutamate permease n=1 Tax=Salmonella enterica subsp. arizonae TaxID=59203 RepID=A0A3S4G332_SALER|nr:glutamate permease [Salmonella enterica subsp. arizonae]